MINISIESFKLLLNEINQIENKNSFIIIREDAFLSKGASNEEMASQDQHLHLCDTDTENTSLLVNNSNISLLFPPNTFMVITFAGALLEDPVQLEDRIHWIIATLSLKMPTRPALYRPSVNLTTPPFSSHRNTNKGSHRNPR